MIKKCKELLVKYREVIVYLIVGVLTTIFSWAVLFLGKLFLNVDISWQNFLNNTLSWAGGVLFAYENGYSKAQTREYSRNLPVLRHPAYPPGYWMLSSCGFL